VVIGGSKLDGLKHEEKRKSMDLEGG